MTTRKEFIVYVTQPVSGLEEVEAHTAAIAAECTALDLEILRQDDLTAVSARPAIGLEVQGAAERIDQIEIRLHEKGYATEDGGREIRALNEEGGA